MRSLGALLIVAGGVLLYFMVVDRQSALALSVVEVMPTGAGGIAVGLGILLIGIDIGRGLMTTRETGRNLESKPTRKAPERLKMDRESRPQTRAAILQKAHTFLGSAARVETDIEGVPIQLTFEHASPEAVKRAVERLGALMLEVPRPPRVRLKFIQCPEPAAPRQHHVAGALAVSLSRSEFKATAHLDRVEIMFFHPDPSWAVIWG